MDDKEAKTLLARSYKLARELHLDNVNMDDLVQSVVLDCVKRGIKPTRKHMMRRGIDVWREMRTSRGVKENLRLGLKSLDDNGFEQIDREDEVDVLMRGASPRERKIVWLMFYEGLTFEEVGQEMSLCKQRISQVLDGLLSRLAERRKPC